jgi:hypothetical protein
MHCESKWVMTDRPQAFWTKGCCKKKVQHCVKEGFVGVCVKEAEKRTLSKSLGLGRDEGGSEHFRKKS